MPNEPTIRASSPSERLYNAVGRATDAISPQLAQLLDLVGLNPQASFRADLEQAYQQQRANAAKARGDMRGYYENLPVSYGVITNMPKTPTKKMTEAYQRGITQRASMLSENPEDVWGQVRRNRAIEEAYYGTGAYPDDVEAAFFNAGLTNKEQPKYVFGWRYGDIPQSGRSYNFRDSRHEMGTSLMQIDGEANNTDGTFEMFNGRGRKKVRVGGWLIDEFGSDGEPLVVGPERIARSKPK